MNRQKRLGRGLEALLNASPKPTDNLESESPRASVPFPTDIVAPTPEPQLTSVTPNDSEDTTGALLSLNVNDIEENPFQPRREFNESEIASLSASLAEHDMLQPVLVREVDGGYQLISGERRLRAAIRAGWMKIPARVRQADDRLVAELAIVENLQRKDLNAIEKAMSFRRYIDQHKCTQEDLAQRLKIDRSTLTNLMRLLELPTLVQDALRNGSLTAGHARALLPLGDADLQIKYCGKIHNEQLNVRQTEQMVADYITREDQTKKKSKSSREKSHQIESLQQEFKMAFGTKVDINATKKGSGKIVIHFQNPREFERLRNLIRSTAPGKAA